MARFEKSVELPASTEDAFAWHERPGAFRRLTPPWEEMEIVEQSGGIRNGGRVVLRRKMGPMPIPFVAEHSGYDPPHRFEDEQQKGPFASWHHVHSFEPIGPDSCCMTDEIDYALPGGWLGRCMAGSSIAHTLERMFAYRHRVTVDDLRLHQSLAVRPHRIAVSGASGLVGQRLCAMLTTGGHEVVRLSRHRPLQDDERYWSPSNQELDPSAIADCDAVIHLAGESVVGRWTESKRQRIRDSRVNSTRLLATAMAQLESGPRTLVTASATGLYGDRGEEILTETSEPGEGFLADVCREWESAADPARDAGLRVSHVRLGMVLSGAGGALASMVRPFWWGVGGPVGAGDQFWHWVAIDDACGLFLWAALNDQVNGPVNAVSPFPIRCKEFTRTLARVLNRPGCFRAPAPVVRTVFGQIADELLLASAAVVPERTLELGYQFRFTDLEDAFRHELGRLSTK